VRKIIVGLCTALTLVVCSAYTQSSDSYQCINHYNFESLGYERIVGGVKSLNVFIETLIPQSHFIFTNPGKPYLFASYSFDSRGKVIEENFYRLDGVALPKTVYVYDKEGKLLKELHYSAVTNQPYLETRYEYERGLLKSILGRSLERDDDFLSKKDFTYDTSKRYVEFLETYSYPSPNFKVGFTLDQKCRLAEVFGFDKNGILAGRNKISYDTVDNPILVEAFLVGGKLVGKSRFDYEFDSNKNWVKQSKKTMDEKINKWILQEIVYRKITY
jgi:hypothetical protein